jgi:hypothetical protein
MFWGRYVVFVFLFFRQICFTSSSLPLLRRQTRNQRRASQGPPPMYFVYRWSPGSPEFVSICLPYCLLCGCYRRERWLPLTAGPAWEGSTANRLLNLLWFADPDWFVSSFSVSSFFLFMFCRVSPKLIHKQAWNFAPQLNCFFSSQFVLYFGSCCFRLPDRPCWPDNTNKCLEAYCPKKGHSRIRFLMELIFT